MCKILIGLLFVLVSCAEDNPAKSPTGNNDGVNNTNSGESNNETSGTNNIVIDGPSIRAPTEVLFPRVEPEAETDTWEIIEVINRGTESLVIYRVEIAGANSPFSVSYPKSASDHPSHDSNVAPGTVASGQSFHIRVYFNPTSLAYMESNLVIITNDPAQPETLIHMRGNFAPCEPVADQLDFGRVVIGSSATLPITLRNCSPDFPLNIESAAISGSEAFRLATSPSGISSDGGTIPPNGSADVLVNYAPTVAGTFEAEVAVVVADLEDDFSWSLVGQTREPGEFQCPTAIAMARLQHQNGSAIGSYTQQITTTPLTYIGFDGTQSTHTDGTISEYEWIVIQRPSNSTARLQSSNTIPKPFMFLDLAGTYIVELVVHDNQGQSSCDDEETRRVTITVTPDEDLHIHLVWDTPTDSDQTDTFGTDLDLHYLHPSGRWNQAPFDIFWRNRTADWGAPGPADDPNLDIDDTDGAGPEIISHNNPQDGLEYQVGVYYYADKGFGPSYATLRIFIEGIERYEWRNEYLEGTGIFWRAATISWPSGQITAINEKQTGFPSNP